MTSEQFLEWAQKLRDLGAVQVSASETGFAATFAPPKQALVAPQPRRHEQPEEPEAKQSYRDMVRQKLTG